MVYDDKIQIVNIQFQKDLKELEELFEGEVSVPVEINHGRKSLSIIPQKERVGFLRSFSEEPKGVCKKFMSGVRGINSYQLAGYNVKIDFSAHPRLCAAYAVGNLVTQDLRVQGLL